MNRMSALCLLLVGSLLVASAVAQIPQVTFKCSDVKAKGATETDAYSVNNAGVIAGDYIDKSGAQHGMLLAGKTLTTFDGPAGSSTIAAYGINNSNVAVGWYVDGNGVIQGFQYSNGTMTSVFFPKSTGTEPNGINDNGWIVGQYFDASGNSHGFYWDTKKYHKLDIKGASYTVAWAINNSNVITEYDVDTSTGLPIDGFTVKGKKFTKVNPPDSAGTAIHGINSNGDLNFTIFDASQNRHGVLYQAATATFTTFDDKKGTNTTRADGLNDSDVQVGRYSPASGTPANAGFKCTVK